MSPRNWLDTLAASARLRTRNPHLNIPVERGLCEIGGGHEHGLVVGHDGFGVVLSS